MNEKGGLVLLSSSPVIGSNKGQESKLDTESMNRSHKENSMSLMEATVLDRLAKCKISNGGKDDEKGNNNECEKPGTNDSTGSISSTISSGIGTEEYSPDNTGDIKEEQDHSSYSHRRGSTGFVASEEVKKESSNDNHHAKSLTFVEPSKTASKFPAPRGGTRNAQHNRGGHLSPAEFFQMSRLRASALANKMNTAATFGGSKDLVTSSTLLNVTQKEKKQETTDEAVEELTKAVKETKLEENDKEEPEEGELIGRSPVPVYANNRHVQHPYRQEARQNAPNRPVGAVPLNANARLPTSEYLRQQRERAFPGHHQYPLQSSPVAAQPLINGSYQAAAPMVDHNQAPPQSARFQPMEHQYVTGEQSPCTGDQSFNRWSGRNENSQTVPTGSPSGNGSPVQAMDEYALGGFPSGVTTHQALPEYQQDAGHKMDELPEALSDFILKYSRRYSTSSTVTTASSNRDGSDSGKSSGYGDQPSPVYSSPRRASNSSISGTSGDESGLEDDRMSTVSSIQGGRPESCQSSVFLDSPMSIPATASPGTPMSGQSINSEGKSVTKYRPLRPKQPTQPGQNHQAAQPFQNTTGGAARKRLREMISQQDFDSAWAWAMRCCQACPGSLLWRDADGDTLLHIVVWHKDYAKTYAITEILMKDDQPSSNKPFDIPNKLDETPLFLAVEKRCADVVAYLLECGANPNLRARNHDGDGALHYAAGRGMLEIVQLFCNSARTNFNLLNGSGMTPLLCAVKNHGVIEEESQCLVNNKPTIRSLLKAGADPMIPDVASGKSVLNYAVERMDPDLIELFRDHLSKEGMCQLVNMPDYNGDTPLHYLTRMGVDQSHGCSVFTRAEGEDELKRKMLNTLIDCGADVNQGGDGIGDEAGSFVVLYPATDEDPTDDVQFTVLDN